MTLLSNIKYKLEDFFKFCALFKKSELYQKLFWPFTVWINCSSDLKNFANSRSSASNFKSFSRTQEQFFLTVGQNNFGNKIPLCVFAGMIDRWSLGHIFLLVAVGVVQLVVLRRLFESKPTSTSHKFAARA